MLIENLLLIQYKSCGESRQEWIQQVTNTCHVSGSLIHDCKRCEDRGFIY